MAQIAFLCDDSCNLPAVFKCRSSLRFGEPKSTHKSRSLGSVEKKNAWHHFYEADSGQEAHQEEKVTYFEWWWWWYKSCVAHWTKTSIQSCRVYSGGWIGISILEGTNHQSLGTNTIQTPQWERPFICVERKRRVCLQVTVRCGKEHKERGRTYYTGLGWLWFLFFFFLYLLDVISGMVTDRKVSNVKSRLAEFEHATCFSLESRAKLFHLFLSSSFSILSQQLTPPSFS
jgi:hypothetical protein